MSDPITYGPTGIRCGCGKDAHSNLTPCRAEETAAAVAAQGAVPVPVGDQPQPWNDDRAVQVLSQAGAMCGVCGDEPGDRKCPDCESCRRDYLECLYGEAGWGPTAALLAEVERLKAELAGVRKELDEYEVMAPQQCRAGKHADWLVDSEYTHACPWCRIAELEQAADALDAHRLTVLDEALNALRKWADPSPKLQPGLNFAIGALLAVRDTQPAAPAEEVAS